MSVSPKAGRAAETESLANIPRLVSAYYTGRPDPSLRGQRVAFGTSGHRGSSLNNAFNEAHILATTEAICRYRKAQGTDGPLFLGMDTHALSEPAFASALEVLCGNGVDVMIDAELGYTPTPAISHAILTWNRGRSTGLADGIVITPSHNPPEDGGFKYNPSNGGPADTVATQWIENQANQLMEGGLRDSRRSGYEAAIKASTTHRHDYVNTYVNDLGAVLDMDAIRAAGIELGADPLGGAGIAYWHRIAERYRLKMKVLHDRVDPTFRFMSLDWDGKIRMDCSSRHAMAGLIALKDQFAVAFACDTDHDRHGIVTRTAGLLNPNHYLAVAIDYLFRHREAVGGAHESESLSLRGDPLSTHASTEVGEGDGRRQNARLEQHDRPGRRLPRPPSRGGAGWIQVVRRWPGGRDARVWRGGERGRQLPPSRQHRLDHGQGRHDHGPALR
jgi:phosphoglucomutase